MEKVEIAIRVLSVCYAVGICIMILRLQGQDTSSIMLQVVFTMVFTCPCLWAIIRHGVTASELHLDHQLTIIVLSPMFGRFCRDYAARRRMVVLPEKKIKKKPDIAVATGKAVQRTQAEILAEQRERVKNLHSVGDKKLKPKAPKRKGPPQKKS
ncbi:hypothetical protein DVH05_022767 [Phytophthora capsici]|nr:hypothetical protein DVH05_022767 [Phytophthora capsici]|eukprot:jgi/Phyca11/11632/fgenesh1_pm.PHYCAscaffold_76_\